MAKKHPTWRRKRHEPHIQSSRIWDCHTRHEWTTANRLMSRTARTAHNLHRWRMTAPRPAPNCEAERQDTDLWSWNVPKHADREDMTRSTATQTSTRQGWKIRTWWCSQSTLLPLLFYPEFLNHTCMHWSMIEHSIGIYMNLCRRCFWSILTGRFPMVVLIA